MSLEVAKQFSPTKERLEKMQNMFFYDLKTVGMYAYLARTRERHFKSPTSQKNKHTLRISLISFPYRFRTTKDASTKPLIISTTSFPHLIRPRKVNKHVFERRVLKTDAFLQEEISNIEMTHKEMPWFGLYR